MVKEEEELEKGILAWRRLYIKMKEEAETLKREGEEGKKVRKKR